MIINHVISKNLKSDFPAMLQCMKSQQSQVMFARGCAAESNGLILWYDKLCGKCEECVLAQVNEWTERERERKRKGKNKGKLEVKLWQKRKNGRWYRLSRWLNCRASASCWGSGFDFWQGRLQFFFRFCQSLNSNFPFSFPFLFFSLSLSVQPFTCAMRRFWLMHGYWFFCRG